MRERPILMSGPMVRAIRLGYKTQTRRVVKVRGRAGLPNYVYESDPGVWNIVYPETETTDIVYVRQCPYGVPGDRLWVREAYSAWHATRSELGHYEPDYPLDFIPKEPWRNPYDASVLFYRADDTDVEGWRPSIHMRRWMSRILLEVLDIRVECVQDISAEDAEAEGWPRHAELFPTINWETKALRWFRQTWNALNMKRGCGWSVNPWVWVIEVEVLEGGVM